MRPVASIVAVVLSVAAPLGAGAATRSSYTDPLSTLHRGHPEEVYLTFENHTSQDREVVIGNQSVKVDYNRAVRIGVPVGSTVRLYSQTNSKVHGQELMQVGQNDAGRTIELK